MRIIEPCCHTHDSRSTVTVYSVRPRLVCLTLHTVRDDRDSLVHVVWLSDTRSQKQKPSHYVQN